jgi:hypothetical protein
MNKTILGLLIGVVLGLVAGYLITTNFLLSEPIPKGYVRVSVENRSGQNIKRLTLKHESGSIEMKNLSKTDSANLIFKNVGENSYRIVAILANGSTISSRGNYVEAGYRTRETIFPDSIKTTLDTY